MAPAFRDLLTQPSSILLDIYGRDHREFLEHADTVIPFHSGWALVAAIVAFLRKRFGPGQPGLPWVWRDEDESPTASGEAGTTTETVITERGGGPGGSTIPSDADAAICEGLGADPDAPSSGIIIETAYNEDQVERGRRPGIYVDRMLSEAVRVGVGDLANQGLRSGNAHFYAMVRSQLSIDVISRKRGESALIAQIAFDALHEGFKDLERAFWIRDVRDFRMLQTVQHQTDTDSWNTPIRFRVEIEKNWFRLPLGVKLREINLHLRAMEERVLKVKIDD